MATIMCPDCRNVSELPDEYLRRSVVCKQCKAVFTATAVGSAARPSQVQTVMRPDTEVGGPVARPSQIKTVLGQPAAGKPVEEATPAPADEPVVLTVMARRVGAKGRKTGLRKGARPADDAPAEAAPSSGHTAIAIVVSLAALLLPIAAAAVFAFAMWGRAWPPH